MGNRRQPKRVESGRRTLYGVVATALLLLFASAAFQLATNLPVVARADLDPGEKLDTIVPAPDGDFYVVTFGGRTAEASPGRYVVERFAYHKLTVGPAGLNLGPPVRIPDENASLLRDVQAVGGGGLRYRLASRSIENPAAKVDDEVRLQWGDPFDARPPRSVVLWRQKWSDGPPDLYRYGDRLFAMGRRLVVVDLSHADAPRVVSDEPFQRGGPPVGGDPQITVDLVPLANVPPADRLAATLGRDAFDGQTLCTSDGGDDGIAGYRLANLDAGRATFDRIGRYRPTLLQELAQGFGSGGVVLRGGLLFVNGPRLSSAFDAGVTVLDTRGRRPMRRVGHFAAPGASRAVPLPDGRAIVAAPDVLYLVGAPRPSGG